MEQIVMSDGAMEDLSRAGGAHGRSAWPTAQGAGELRDIQRSFSAVLGRAREVEQSAEERAREAAEQLVAQTFVGPMLKELRESDRTAPPFAPSRAEKQFRALMDAELAQRLVKAGRFGLVERVAQNLLKLSGDGDASRPVPSGSDGGVL